ncbi:MAG: hypothetical protein ACK5V5_11030 [Cyclobacteriaceae bacterium]|nr:hypothetical protein [Flammeovirgaceae bacterium]
MAICEQQLVPGDPVPSRERWRQLFEPAGACAVGGVPMFIGSRQRDPAARKLRGHAQKIRS